MSNQVRGLALLATTALLSLVPLSASAASISFDTVAAQTIAAGGSVGVDAGFTAAIAGASDGARGIIDTGGGTLATAACSLTGACADNGTQALYVLQNASFTLSAPSGDTFTATSFDAALASIWPAGFPLNSAVRLQVDGLAGATTIASKTFLLLPPEYTDTLPADTASSDATTLKSITLAGYNNIDALVFTIIAGIEGDPSALTVDTGFSTEFAVDNIGYTALDNGGGDNGGGTSAPEPATAALLLAGLAGLAATRRRIG